MADKAAEISKVIKDEIKNYRMDKNFEEAGTVVSIGDGIAHVYGLTSVMSGELLEFSNGTTGMALNLNEDSIGVIVMDSDGGIKEGDPVKLTGRTADVPVGDGLIGRVVNSIGEPIDGKGPITADSYRPIETQAPSVISRTEVDKPLETGIKAIDSLVPIGKGQRELIIGDRQTGKTAIAIDTIINQKGKGVKCVYVAIGQKASTVANILSTLEDNGAMDYTTIVLSTASDGAALQYIAPYAGTSIAEEWMYRGEDSLVIYDDLSKHAVAYRAISLLLNRPPGREAYPGDVFYLHSRLLERASSLNEENGGGTMSALPIVETQDGDISAYIPTNVISITDGQIYLESDLFNSGVRPAINPGLSVSRVGGSAQVPAMKKITGPMRIEYAQYKELAAFSQFGSDLNPETIAQLNHGERIMEVLKQPQSQPMNVADQILIFYALANGYLESVDISNIQTFERDLFQYVDSNAPEVKDDIRETGDVSEENEKKINEMINKLLEMNDYD